MSAGWRSANSYAIVVTLLLSILAQGTLLGRIRLFGVSPDLLLIAVICWSLIGHVTSGLIWAFLAGIGADLIAGSPLGSASLALMPVALLGGAGRNSVYGNNTLLPVVLVLLATPLHGVVVLGLQQVQGVPVDWMGTFTRVIVPALILNGLLMLPVMRVMGWLSLRLEPAGAR